MAQKVCIRGAYRRAFRRGKVEVVFAQALEEGSYRLDVGRRISAENDHIVEVGRHLCQTFNVLVNYLDDVIVFDPDIVFLSQYV